MPVFHICGGGHLDRHLHLEGEVVLGRTNPAAQRIEIGGVAANIARHLAAVSYTHLTLPTIYSV